MIGRTLTVAGMLALAAPGAAQDYGYRQIASGNLPLAEAQLDAARIVQPREPAVLINLAAVYARSGRDDDATAMYRAALAAENVQLELGNGAPAWSHDLARRGLRQVTLAAR